MTLYNPFEAKMRKIKITPTQDGLSLTWQCPRCEVMNELLKTQIGENKLFPCSNEPCDYKWVLGVLPDDMRHWLKETGIRNVNVRPRIVRR